MTTGDDIPRDERDTAPAGADAADDGPDRADAPAIKGSGGTPDTVDRAAAPYPALAWVARNRWQALAVLWILLTIFSVTKDGSSFRTWFAVIMTVLFTAAAVFELRGRRRIAARRAAAAGEDRPVR